MWQVRLREWQGLTVGLAKQQVPAVYSWLGAQMDSFVQRQNLTEVCLLLSSPSLRPPTRIPQHGASPMTMELQIGYSNRPVLCLIIRIIASESCPPDGGLELWHPAAIIKNP